MLLRRQMQSHSSSTNASLLDLFEALGPAFSVVAEDQKLGVLADGRTAGVVRGGRWLIRTALARPSYCFLVRATSDAGRNSVLTT